MKKPSTIFKKVIKGIKIKVGKDPKEDIGKVALIREKLKEEVQIRIDANQFYRVDRVIPVFKLEIIEQFVSVYDVKGMRKITDALNTLMADKSVFSLKYAFKAISDRASDIINIKVGKVGGLLPNKKNNALTESANIPWTIGSNLELRIEIVTSLHFALSTPNIFYPCDLTISPFLNREDIIDPSFELIDRRINPLEG
ncbi:MAG: enolase C-terminal domain-like protein [Thermodesulfobacteriota bacterium]